LGKDTTSTGRARLQFQQRFHAARIENTRKIC
jgi:hypothetical protein